VGSTARWSPKAAVRHGTPPRSLEYRYLPDRDASLPAGLRHHLTCARLCAESLHYCRVLPCVLTCVVSCLLSISLHTIYSHATRVALLPHSITPSQCRTISMSTTTIRHYSCSCTSCSPYRIINTRVAYLTHAPSNVAKKKKEKKEKKKKKSAACAASLLSCQR
jgi:hypothetical protein